MPPARWDQIAEAVRAEIRNGSRVVGDKLPSENELVVTWGVSRMTAHRAMKELQREGLVLRRRGRGTVVASVPGSHSGTIAVLLHHTESAFEGEYLGGVRMILPDDYRVLYFSMEDRATREAQCLQRMRKEADAIIFLPTCSPENSRLLLSIIESGKPVICVDRYPEEPPIDAVVTDNYGAVVEALRHLHSRGHSRMAYFGSYDPHVSAARERYLGFADSMVEFGCENVDEYTRWISTGPLRSAAVDAAKDALFRLQRLPEPITAAVCVNDKCMSVILEACDGLGLSVPNDIEMVSFCEAPLWTLRNAESINRIVQQTKAMGEIAARKVKAMLEGEPPRREVTRVPALFYPSGTSAL